MRTSTLSAGIIAYPAKMADEITARVEKELAAWNLSLIRQQMEKLQENLASAMPTAETKLKPPKLSSPVMTALRNLAGQMQDEDHDQLEEWFDRATKGWRGPDPITFGDFAQGDVLPKIRSLKSLEDLSTSWLNLIWRMLLEVKVRGDVGGTTIDKAGHDVWQHLRAVESLERRKLPATSPQTIEIRERSVKRFHEELEALETLSAFYKSFGAKPAKSIRREWSMPIDVSDLPKSYPLDATKDGYKKLDVILMISKRNRSFGGRWNSTDKTIELVAPQTMEAMTEAQFRGLKSRIRTTIEHEAQHLIQWIIRDSLKLRARDRLAKEGKLTPTTIVPQPKSAERAGTPFGPRHAIPKREGNAAEKAAYRKATEKERYYLDPIEFFPQITTWVNRFIQYGHAPDVWVPGPDSPTMHKWKAWVGLPHDAALAKGVEPALFYTVLKKHDQRLWKRAVAEGWKILVEKTKSPRWKATALREKLKQRVDERKAMPVDRKAVARTLRATAARLDGCLVLSAGVKYDPENPAHREELANKMKAKLGAAGFKLSTDRTLDPGRQYGGGWKGKEEVWVFQHRKDPGLEVQVFTSITQGGSVRSKGADAIRVCLIYKNKAKQTGTENPEARQYDLGSECRVHRTGDIDDIVERTVERARDAYKRANEVERCGKCSAPMAMSKAGKAFCSEVCWLPKKPGGGVGGSISGSVSGRSVLALGPAPWTVEQVEQAWRQYKAQHRRGSG